MLIHTVCADENLGVFDLKLEDIIGEDAVIVP